ncbi:hypothetical protein INR49_017728 [Caranx melampygus]|nr:hypothetical protein INR49_017728 [Caranx melampygus]
MAALPGGEVSLQTQTQASGGRLQGRPCFCLEIQDVDRQEPGGSPVYRLKSSHSYFTQIQCQLAVTGLQQADLVVYTLKETAIVPVTFDSDLWEETVSKLEVFYRDAVLPHLRAKKQQETASARAELCSNTVGEEEAENMI